MVICPCKKSINTIAKNKTNYIQIYFQKILTSLFFIRKFNRIKLTYLN